MEIDIKKICKDTSTSSARFSVPRNTCSTGLQISDRIPVAHCEVAGEWIEFNWGCSNIVYMYKLLEDKGNKNKFHILVRLVLVKDVFTLSVCRANSCRARQCMLVYIVLDEQQKNQLTITNHQSDKNDTQYKQWQ